MNSNDIISVGPQTLQYRPEPGRLDEELLTSPGVHHPPQFPPRSVTEDAIPGPGPQPAEYQHQNFLRPAPNNGSDRPGSSDEDKDDSYGPNN